MADLSLDEFMKAGTCVPESYVTFSRDDPHYITFLKQYMSDSKLRWLLANSLAYNESYYDHQIREKISQIFDVKIDSILVFDIIAIRNQVYEDLRRIAERLTDADIG